MRKILLLSLICLAMILSINYVIGSIYSNRSVENAYSSMEKYPDQISELTVSIYPNPLTEDKLTIEANREIKEIEILDIVGKTIFKEHYENNIARTSVDFRNYSKGLYIVKIAFEGKKFYTEKILYK